MKNIIMNNKNPSINGLELAKWCYRKFYMEDARIGYDELGEEICNYIANSIGNHEHAQWIEDMRKDIDNGNHA